MNLWWILAGAVFVAVIDWIATRHAKKTGEKSVEIAADGFSILYAITALLAIWT